MILLTGNIPHLTPKRAFTLVEMLVVLAIITMLLAISIPFTSGFGKGLRIKTSARSILGTLRVARSNAITQRKKIILTFDVETSEYWIQDAEGKIYEKKSRLPGSIKFEVANEEGADPITFKGDKVTFDSAGSAEGGNGSITISDRQGNSRTISIIGSTGKITID